MASKKVNREFSTRLRCDGCGKFISRHEPVKSKDVYGFMSIDRTEVFHSDCFEDGQNHKAKGKI